MPDTTTTGRQTTSSTQASLFPPPRPPGPAACAATFAANDRDRLPPAPAATAGAASMAMSGATGLGDHGRVPGLRQMIPLLAGRNGAANLGPGAVRHAVTHPPRMPRIPLPPAAAQVMAFWRAGVGSRGAAMPPHGLRAALSSPPMHRSVGQAALEGTDLRSLATAFGVTPPWLQRTAAASPTVASGGDAMPGHPDYSASAAAAAAAAAALSPSSELASPTTPSSLVSASALASPSAAPGKNIFVAQVPIGDPPHSAAAVLAWRAGACHTITVIMDDKGEILSAVGMGVAEGRGNGDKPLMQPTQGVDQKARVLAEMANHTCTLVPKSEYAGGMYAEANPDRVSDLAETSIGQPAGTYGLPTIADDGGPCLNICWTHTRNLLQRALTPEQREAQRRMMHQRDEQAQKAFGD